MFLFLCTLKGSLLIKKHGLDSFGTIDYNKKAEEKVPESISDFPEQERLEEDLMTEGKKAGTRYLKQKKEGSKGSVFDMVEKGLKEDVITDDGANETNSISKVLSQINKLDDDGVTVSTEKGGRQKRRLNSALQKKIAAALAKRKREEEAKKAKSKSKSKSKSSSKSKSRSRSSSSSRSSSRSRSRSSSKSNNASAPKIIPFVMPVNKKSYYTNVCPKGPHYYECLRHKLNKIEAAKTGDKVSFKKHWTYNFSAKEQFDMSSDKVENPVFSAILHTQDTNYFTLTLPPMQRYHDHYTYVINFIRKWMNLKNFESVKVKEMKIGKRKAVNRYEIKYYNRITRKVKLYYVDVDFQDDKEEAGKYIKIADVAKVENHTIPTYNNVYESTLIADCRAIAKRFYDPFSIKCFPIMNKVGYVLKHLYEAKMVFKKDGEVYSRDRLVLVVPAQPKPAVPLFPTKKPFKKLERLTPNELIDLRTKFIRAGIPKRFFTEVVNTDTLTKKKISEVILKAQQFENKINDGFQDVERVYQGNVTLLLSDQTNNSDKSAKAYDLTYDRLVLDTAKVNAFNISTQIKFMMRRLQALETLRIHRRMAAKYAKVVINDRLDEHKNFLQYMRDRKLDEYFEKKSYPFRVKAKG